MGNQLSHVKAGDPITAWLFNEIIDRIEPFSKFSVSGYLGMMDGPYTGTCLWLNLPTDQMARLSGNANPYAWQAVYWDGSSGWVDGPNTSYNGTDAYELNGATGLDGKVVRMSWSTAGDWRFQALRYGCNLVFKLLGCNGCPVAGATVDFVLGGVTVHSTTTNSTGDAAFPNAPGGSYTIDWAVPGTTFSGSEAVDCSAPGVTHTITARAGETCTSNCALPQPLASLFVTDNAGTRLLGACVDYVDPNTGLAWSTITTLAAIGTCVSPAWTVKLDGKFPSPCSSPLGPFMPATKTITGACTTPFLLTGNYKTTGDGPDTHILVGTPFSIHT